MSSDSNQPLDQSHPDVPVTIGGKQVLVRYSHRSAFRLQTLGYSPNALKQAADTVNYMFLMCYLWATLPPKEFKRYDSPEDLCDHFDPEDTDQLAQLATSLMQAFRLANPDPEEKKTAP